MYGISESFSKIVSNELVISLAILINRCFSEKFFPDELKLARIVAVPKKKDIINDCLINYDSANRSYPENHGDLG